MNNSMDQQLETQIRSMVSAYPYPPTPDLRRSVVERTHPRTSQPGRTLSRMAWVLAILVLMVMVTSFAVPSVRAKILEFIQIGGIRIYTEPTATLQPHDQEDVQPGVASGPATLVTSTPFPTLQTYPSIDDLAGETTLDALRAALPFQIPLPDYPPDLGLPDRVFLQDLEGPGALLIWLDPQQPERIRMNLLILGQGAFAGKGMPPVLEETTVNGHLAVWMQGSHILHLGGNTYQGVPLVVDGNVLAWEVDGITYRLQTDLPLEEAVRIAESLE